MLAQEQQTAPQPPQPPLTQSNEELCNLLIQSLVAKDEKLMQRVLEQNDEVVIKDVVNRIPVNHVRKLVIELSNLMAIKLCVNHLQWLQHILAQKYSVISSMADGRSILLPLISLLEDRSAPAYFNKMQALKGKLLLLNQLREVRKSDTAQKVVSVRVEPEQPAVMEVESESDTDSEEDFEDENAEEDEGGEIMEGGDDIADDLEENDDEEEPRSPDSAQSDEDL